MQRLSRVDPALPVGAMQTYAAVAPLPTHWREATCQEVDCRHWREGWRTIVPAGSPQADYIRAACGRQYVEVDAGPGLVGFEFAPEQRCFGDHRVPLEREPLYLVRGGDWRGNPTGQQRRHQRAADWVDDFATHQQQLADRS